jgi:hypothetical protein
LNSVLITAFDLLDTALPVVETIAADDTDQGRR